MGYYELKNLFQPQLLASVFHQLLPVSVGLGDNFLCEGNILEFFVESEFVEWLVIGGLVPSEPFSDSGLDGLGDILDVVVFLGERIIDGNGNNLPVQFAIVDHSENTKNLDFVDASGIEGLGSDFDNIDRIVVTHDFQLGVLDVGVFPSL